MNPSKEYVIATLGCKANFSDSETLEAQLQRRGWSRARQPIDASLCIVNSCTVTDEADRQSRKMASKLARHHPHASIVITGCGAEVAPEKLQNTRGLHYVVGNQDKHALVDILLERLARDQKPKDRAEILGGVRPYAELLSQHPEDREWPATHAPERAAHTSKTRAFFKIQEGCNSFCTYCIIPYGRGPSRSLSLEEIRQKTRELEADGVREVVLTGTNLGDFGTDIDTTLEAAMGAILESSNHLRIRLSSLDPVEITPRLFEMVRTETRICPHFHVSLQSPTQKILRLMKRKYREEDVVHCLEKIHKIPDVFVGMDLITGFPGETEEDFERSVRILEKLPWTRLHVFPYSERAGTPATRLKDSVPMAVRKARTRILNQLSLQRLEAHYRRLDNKPLPAVLTETGGQGYTANYLRVRFSHPVPENQLLSAQPLRVVADPTRWEVHFEAQVLN